MAQAMLEKRRGFYRRLCIKNLKHRWRRHGVLEIFEGEPILQKG